MIEYTTLDTPVDAQIFQFVYGDTPKGSVEISIYNTVDTSLTDSWTWQNGAWTPAAGNNIAATATDRVNYIEVILDEPMENVAVGQAVGIDEMYYC